MKYPALVQRCNSRFIGVWVLCTCAVCRRPNTSTHTILVHITLITLVTLLNPKTPTHNTHAYTGVLVMDVKTQALSPRVSRVPLHVRSRPTDQRRVWAPHRCAHTHTHTHTHTRTLAQTSVELGLLIGNPGLIIRFSLIFYSIPT